MIFRFLSVFALFSPFFFPWLYTAVVAIIASIRYPLVALIVGIEIDTLYYVHGVTSLPYASVWGVLVMILAMLARRFTKAYLITS